MWFPERVQLGEGTWPPHSGQLETAGPRPGNMLTAAKAFAMGHCHSWSTRPAHQLFLLWQKTHKQVVVAPLHFFIQNIFWRPYPRAHVMWNITVSDQKPIHLRSCNLVQLQRCLCLSGLKGWKVYQSEKSGCLRLPQREETYWTTFPGNIQKPTSIICKLCSEERTLREAKV